MKQVIGVLAVSLLTSFCYATEYRGKIQSIGTGLHYDSLCTAETCAVIMVSDSHTGPGCHDGAWNFIMRTDTTSGKNSFSLLLAAYAAGQELVIGGTGNCALDTNDNMETVNYLYYKYQ